MTGNLHALRSVDGTRRVRLGTAVVATLSAMAMLGGCATVVDSGTVTPLARADAALRQAQSAWQVQLRARPERVRVGDALRFDITSARPGYLYLYQVSTEGKLSLVFPNSMDAANAVTHGAITLPGPTWALRARGPAGTGYFLAVVSEAQQDLLAIGEQVARGDAPRVAGPYGAAMVTLQEAN